MTSLDKTTPCTNDTYLKGNFLYKNIKLGHLTIQALLDSGSEINNDFNNWLRGLNFSRQQQQRWHQPGQAYHHRLNHPLVYREVFHECSWAFDSTSYLPVPIVQTTQCFVLAEYVHFGQPRVVAILPVNYQLCKQQLPTYHFIVLSGTTMAEPFLQQQPWLLYSILVTLI